MKKITLAGALVLAPLLSALPILGAAGYVANAAASTEQFVEKVAVSDMFEIESGKLAASRAQNAEVKSFGQQMVDDHTKTTNELKQLLKDHDIKVELPTALDKSHQSKLDKLKDTSGDAFDRTYVPMQVSAHEEAVDLFQAYAETGDNPDLKQWAEKTLPALKGHLDEAKQLNSSLKTSASDTDDRQALAEKDKVAAQDGKDRKAAMVEQRKDRAASFEFVTRQQPTDWSAQALIGRTIENQEGDNLGDINNVILNEKGNVVAVTIGVGGFLGLGEKNVGVPFDALEFKADQRTSADEPASGDRDDRDDRQSDPSLQADRFDSEHSNVRIVLNATKEELESAPEFVWLDERDTDDTREKPVVR